MTVLDVLAELSRLGVRLEAHNDGRLRYSPQKVVPPSLVEEIRAHKAELLDYLRIWGDCWPVDSGEAINIDKLEPCPKCGSLELWETFDGTWRCQHCESDALQRSRELADRTKRLRASGQLPPLRRQRQTRPARASPETAVERDEVKGVSPEKQRVLFDGVSSEPERKRKRRRPYR